MIDVKLEDFEFYRKELLNYALGLLKSRGSARTLNGELDEKAKDIVQETYLAFHSSRLDCFVSKQHLHNFLNICLYKNYQMSIHPTRKIVQYNLFKNGNLDYLQVDEDDNENMVEKNIPTEYQLTFEQEDLINKFMSTLNEKQQNLVDKLLLGFTGGEISKELNISRQAINQQLEVIRKKYKNYESTSI